MADVAIVLRGVEKAFGTTKAVRPSTLAVATHAEGDVFADRQVREQRVALRHQAHAAMLGLDPAPAPGHGAAGDRHGPAVGPLEAGDQPQQRRLARSARAEQAEQLPVGHLEIDAVHAPACAEAPGDGLQSEGEPFPCQHSR